MPYVAIAVGGSIRDCTCAAAWRRVRACIYAAGPGSIGEAVTSDGCRGSSSSSAAAALVAAGGATELDAAAAAAAGAKGGWVQLLLLLLLLVCACIPNGHEGIQFFQLHVQASR
jgi:hypothetical protein